MNNEELEESLKQYDEQLSLVAQSLSVCTDDTERSSLITLQSDLNQLINLTKESLTTVSENGTRNREDSNKPEIDDEYALFMQEMAKSGAYDDKNSEGEPSNKANDEEQNSDDSDIEGELASLAGMKCAVQHTFKWGGQSSLHNAMICAVVPRHDDDDFTDLKVQVLFTHPTHADMLPCPFFLEGDCRFDNDQCRYSHGNVVQFSNLKEAIEPDFESIKVGSRVLVKLVPPDDKDISLKKKCTEKYHLWHRSVVKSVDLEIQSCVVRLEHGARSEKGKSHDDQFSVAFENIFPLNDECASDSDSDSLSDIECPEYKSERATDDRSLVAQQSVQRGGQALGEWEKHTRGIGSKLMFAMGYVAGEGLGVDGAGRVLPVPATLVPRGRGLDHCVTQNQQDPIKIEQKLKRMQKREEERQKRAYEREKEKEERNVFNFLNRTIGDQQKETTSTTNIKQTSMKDLHIEQFKISEKTKKLTKEMAKLQNSLSRHSKGTSEYKNIQLQINEKIKEQNALQSHEKHVFSELLVRTDKKKMTVF